MFEVLYTVQKHGSIDNSLHGDPRYFNIWSMLGALIAIHLVAMVTIAIAAVPGALKKLKDGNADRGPDRDPGTFG